MTDPPPPPSPAAECLERTRSAVLNVLIAAGTGIAISGWLLRWRDRWALSRVPVGVGRGLLAGLFVLAVGSYAVRRAVSGVGNARGDAAGRAARVYRGHVASAALAALAVPLGLAYGWLVRPRLDAVAPFWVAALALGFLALPRAHVLEGIDPGDTSAGAGETDP